MNERGAAGRKDPTVEAALAGKAKEAPTTKMAVNGRASATRGEDVPGTKSASFRHCKSFNSSLSKESMIPKAPSSHENSKMVVKTNGACKSGDIKVRAKDDNGPILLRSEKLNIRDQAAGNPGGNLNVTSPSKTTINGELQYKRNTLKETVLIPKDSPAGLEKISTSSKIVHFYDPPTRKPKETPPQHPASLANVKTLSLSLNADPSKPIPPIRTRRVGGTTAKSTPSTKNTANLCTECKAELEGAVCFIGNDGRVSACTSRMAVRICKNLKCANNNPDHVESLAPSISGPKKYLVSKRHSLNLPRSSTTGSKSSIIAPTKSSADVLNGNGSVSDQSSGSITTPRHDGDKNSDEHDVQGEDDMTSLEEIADNLASLSPHTAGSLGARRPIGYQRMRRRSFSVIETQCPEVVTLRKQMMHERKHAEEWMLDYAIEEALHRLVPSRDSKVKALVEAFESIIPQKDTESMVSHEPPEASKTPS